MPRSSIVAAEVGGRSLGNWPTPAWTVPLAWSHAWLMLFGLFPWFVFGFAMMAVPNWTGRDPQAISIVVLLFVGALAAAQHLAGIASLDGWTWVVDAPMAAWVGWLA